MHSPLADLPTLYINLSHRTDRRRHVEAELEKVGAARVERVEAIARPNGALGCTLSHIHCLELALSRDYDCVFVCEDDITFTNPALLNQHVHRFLSKSVGDWDVLILGGNLCPPFQKVCGGAAARIVNCQTTTGYIVQKHYYSILINNFRESAATNTPLDLGWKRLQARDRWYMILPATVTQYENYSDIEKRTVNYSWLMLDVEKQWWVRQQTGAPPAHSGVK
jgi:glycosyl transferase family 25